MMISINNFSEEIRKYNNTKYLKSIIDKVNNNEGYVSLLGNHVIFNKYSTGRLNKIARDRYLMNNMNGIVSFELKNPLIK